MAQPAAPGRSPPPALPPPVLQLQQLAQELLKAAARRRVVRFVVGLVVGELHNGLGHGEHGVGLGAMGVRAKAGGPTGLHSPVNVAWHTREAGWGRAQGSGAAADSDDILLSWQKATGARWGGTGQRVTHEACAAPRQDRPHEGHSPSDCGLRQLLLPPCLPPGHLRPPHQVCLWGDERLHAGGEDAGAGAADALVREHVLAAGQVPGVGVGMGRAARPHTCPSAHALTG